MSASLREKRIANEWAYLLSLARENPDLLHVAGRRQEPAGECFQFTLEGTAAYVGPPNERRIRSTHTVTMRFPEFYPAVPCEAFLKETVFHPNVHPVNGFICLWDRFSPGTALLKQFSRFSGWCPGPYTTHRRNT